MITPDARSFLLLCKLRLFMIISPTVGRKQSSSSFSSCSTSSELPGPAPTSAKSLASRPGLRHLGHDNLDLVFRSLVTRKQITEQHHQLYRIQNYEQTLPRDSAEEEETLTLLSVATTCPNIRTARIRSDKVTYNSLKLTYYNSTTHSTLIGQKQSTPTL